MSKNALETTLGSDIEITYTSRHPVAHVYRRDHQTDIHSKCFSKIQPVTPNDGPTLMERNWLHDIMLD